jgi:DNA-binding MarR family transcriptional regulator
MPGHLVRRVQQISSAIFSEEMAEFELTSVQFIALVAVADNDGLDATRLAESIDFDKATIGGVIDRLERKGLIERKVSARDKRVKELAATPAGRALITVSFARVETVQERLLAPLSPKDRTLLMQLLQQIVDSADS